MKPVVLTLAAALFFLPALFVRAEPAIEVDEGELNRELESGYGIFSGDQVTWATLRNTSTCCTAF